MLLPNSSVHNNFSCEYFFLLNYIPNDAVFDGLSDYAWIILGQWSARLTTSGCDDVRAHHCQGLHHSQGAFENSRNSLFCRANFALSFEVLHDLNHWSVADKIAKQWKLGDSRFFRLSTRTCHLVTSRVFQQQVIKSWNFEFRGFTLWAIFWD